MRRFDLLIVLAALLMAGCGKSDSTNDAADNNFTILEGDVPGTLIEAFCGNGGYYAVHSDDNGSARHPFALTIPRNLNCRLVMTTHEEENASIIISPIRIIAASGASPRFYGVAERADLGSIPLPMDRADINDTTGDAVADDLFDVASGDGALVTVDTAGDPLDADDDGIPNVYEDDDNDTVANRYDADDDNNGIEDVEEGRDDVDGDGIFNDDDIDDDNDGVDDAEDPDDDNDGIPDDDEIDD